MAQQIKSGQDVTSLMGPAEVAVTIRDKPKEIQSGEDVTSLMRDPFEVDDPSLLEKLWKGVNTPIVNVPSSTERIRQEHPIISGVGDFTTSVLSGLTTPLNVTTGGMFGGAKVAASKGLQKIATSMLAGGKALSAPVVAEGAINLGHPNSTMPERVVGGLELVGGIMGMKAKLPRVAESLGSSLPDKPVDLSPTEAISQQAELPLTEPIVNEPIGKLLEALKTSRPLNKEQAAIYSAEKASRISQVESVKTKGESGYYEKLGKLKGEYPKVQMEPLVLEQADVDSLIDTVAEFPTLTSFQKINATSGLTKILEGQVPQKSELDLLTHVFGQNVIDQMRASLPKVDVKRSLIAEAVNLPRSIQAAYDISFPFRQGLGLIHTKPWWTSWSGMVKSYGNEKAYRGVMESILSRPNYQAITVGKTTLPSFAQRAGLALTDLTDLASREEAIMSTFAEKIPGIRASNRAYTAFANKLRADNFDSLIKDAEGIYQAAKKNGKLKPEQIEMLNPRTNLVLAKSIASFVNNASGRGSLGSLEKSAVALNSLLFSPRLMASRLQMMNPANYVTGSPQVRKEYLKSMLATAGAWMTMAGLAKMGGAEVSMNPDSSDFGKIKIGNTRFDPAGGFQQYLVLLHRMGSGEYTSSTSGRTTGYGSRFGAQERGDAIVNFIRNKLAPVPSFASSPFFANKSRPFDVVDRSIRMFTPIILQDLSEIVQEDPSLLPGLIPSAIGLGIQSYDERGWGSKMFGKSQPEMEVY